MCVVYVTLRCKSKQKQFRLTICQNFICNSLFETVGLSQQEERVSVNQYSAFLFIKNGVQAGKIDLLYIYQLIKNKYFIEILWELI